MRKLLLLTLLSLPLALNAAPNTAPQAQEQKIQVIRHNPTRCVVTGQNIMGDRKKFEVVYTEGNVEHHFYVADRSAMKKFFKNPVLYMAKLKQMEGSSAGN